MTTNGSVAGAQSCPTSDDGCPLQHPSTDPKLFVCALRCGRLANRLVLFANLIALVEEQGHRLVNVTFHSYASLFETTRRDIYCRYPVAERSSWFDTIPCIGDAIRKTRIFYHGVRAASQLNERLPIFGSSIVTLRETPGRWSTPLDGPEVQDRIRNATIVFVYGWTFRAPNLIGRHAEKIRAYFKPIEEYDRSSRQAVERLRESADVVVGVHIRQGDYRGLREGRCYFPTSQYAIWMHELAEQFSASKVSFLVCSDEPRHTNEFPGLSVGFGPGSPLEDLYALAECDYLMGPLSTFSQWASFYGNKPLFHLCDRTAQVERGKFRVSQLAELP